MVDGSLAVQLPGQFPAILKLGVPMQLEGLPVDLAHIVGLPHQLQVLFQSQQLSVLSRVVGQHWHCIIQLVEAGEWRVVHQHYL